MSKRRLGGLLILLLGCTSKEAETVSLMQAAAVIPPLDAAAPAKTETISFAVG